MNEKADPAVPSVWLTVSFDAEQLGSQLVWQVSENRHSLFERYGPFAGSLLFPKNCSLGVEVRGCGNKSLRGFEVESAVLVTVPADARLSPSPFKGVEIAVAPVGPLPPVNQVVFDPKNNLTYGITGLADALFIGDEDGAWELSMVLTVRVRLIGHDGEEKWLRRVFRFDPESYVGNGTRPR